MNSTRHRIDRTVGSPSKLLGLLVALTVLSVFGVLRLGVNNGVDTWLPDNDPALLVVLARR